jgi:hypothetical protein
MRRREFLTLLTGAVVGWPVVAQGQSTRKVWRLGYLADGPRATSGSTGGRAAFFAALQDSDTRKVKTSRKNIGSRTIESNAFPSWRLRSSGSRST